MFQKKQLAKWFLLLGLSLVYSKGLLAQPLFSIKPLALLYQNLSGQVQSDAAIILAPSKNLHDLSFSMADMQKINQGDVVYWLGADTSPELEKMRQRFSEKAWRSLQQNAHSWLDPKQLPLLIDAMVTAMSSAKPSEREHYWQRADALKLQLAQIFKQAKTQWKSTDVTFLIGHSAFEPLLSYLKVPVYEYYQGHSHGGQQTGFKEKVALLEKIQSGEISCALEEPDVSFEALAKRFPSLKRIPLEPMAGKTAYSEQGFVEFIQQNLQQLELCQNNRG